MRAFLAVPLPADVRRRLADWSAQIDGLSAQAEETLHLTLRFLGEIADPEPIHAALAPVIGRHPAFRIGIERLGGFPRHNRANVLWVGISDPELRAGALASSVGSALETVGVSPDRRPWRGHITLGRFPAVQRISKRLRAAPHDFGEVPVDRVILFGSTLHATGAVHTPLAEMSLAVGM